MSAGYLRRCAGKERLDTRQEAVQRRAALSAGRDVDKHKLHVYRCIQCLGYHVGRPTRKFITQRRRSGKRANRRMRGR